jgi:hypothetical protein
MLSGTTAIGRPYCRSNEPPRSRFECSRISSIYAYSTPRPVLNRVGWFARNLIVRETSVRAPRDAKDPTAENWAEQLAKDGLGAGTPLEGMDRKQLFAARIDWCGYPSRTGRWFGRLNLPNRGVTRWSTTRTTGEVSVQWAAV